MKANLISQSLGRYHILEQLGEGGMATVYKAYDTRLESEVAVKVIRTESMPQNAIARALKRFEREAKLLARLTHPNIVKVIDYGEYDGKPYLVMPYLPGGTLKQKLGKPIPWQEAVQLLSPIAEALDYAHSQGMIHRDVKPSNILLTERGQPLLTDFGIAKVLDVEETMDLTGTSAAVGTPEYMAPEQVTSKSVDHRADIYALGVVFYEMVTGRKPYTADTPMAVLFKHASEPLPRPRSFVPSLPDGVEKLLLKALAKKPEDRYQKMSDFARALAGLLQGKVTDRKSALPKVERAPTRKKQIEVKRLTVPRRMIIALGSIVIGIGLFFLGSKFLSNLPATLSPTHTPSQVGTQTPSFTSTPEDTPTPLFTAITTPLLVEITDEKGVLMRLVPAGEFIMGSENGDPDEQPIHKVYLDALYIDKYEVTNARYKDCVEAGVCLPPHSSESYTRSAYYGDPQFGDYPVVQVDWNMAKTFCEWRGANLPTEAQWEKAARGTDGRTYPWGEELDCNKANYSGCVGDTTKIGSYESGISPYGVYEMAGNVSEWVLDWHSKTYYYNSPLYNPLGPESGESRITRGGAFYTSSISSVRTSDRVRLYPEIAGGSNGFRCAVSASGVDSNAAVQATHIPSVDIATSAISQTLASATPTLKSDIPIITYGKTLSFSDAYGHKIGFYGAQGDVISLFVWGGSRNPELVAKMKPYLLLADVYETILVDKSGTGAINIINYILPYTGGYYVQFQVFNTKYYEFTLRLEKP